MHEPKHYFSEVETPLDHMLRFLGIVFYAFTPPLHKADFLSPPASGNPGHSQPPDMLP